MAMYKIPQDVEADDKFLGPLSFKQFLFAGVAAISCYLSFLSLTKGLWPVLFVLFPFILVGGFLGFPWGRDQPTEIWLAARIRFFIKPRTRIWNQSGVKELVTVTVPKRVEKHYTDGLSQTEVKSRLSGLAALLDSRGWAVKNVDQSVYSRPLTADQNNDRLFSVSTVPLEVSDAASGIDVLDESVNNTALHFEEMIKISEQKHRKEIMQRLQDVRQDPVVSEQTQPQQADFRFLQQPASMQPATQTPTTQQNDGGGDFWFLGGTQGGTTTTQSVVPPVQPEPAYSTFQAPSIIAPASTTTPVTPVFSDPSVAQVDESALLEKIHNEHQNAAQQYSHLRTIQPIGMGQPAAPQLAPQSNMTTPVDPAIINLASNDDLSVETLARQANKQNEQHLSDDEVVISLH